MTGSKILQIAEFLKNNPDKVFTNSDIAKNLKINPSTVSTSLSRLRNGTNKLVKKRINVSYTNKNGKKISYSRNVKKIDYRKNGQPKKVGYKGYPMRNFKKSNKGNSYSTYTKKQIDSRFKTWKVDFKLIETNSKNKKKNKWIDKMDLSAYAIGIVPFEVNEQKVIEVAGLKLFRQTLDKMQDENISLWSAVKENDENSVYIGAEILNENALDENYNAQWDGQITFVNNVGVTYHFNIKFYVGINEYD